MRTLLITDVETTGLDPATERVIEVATVRYDVPSASVIETFSTLMHGDSNAAEAVNRIGVDALIQAMPAKFAWRMVSDRLDRLIDDAAFVAHRAEFDRSFYPRELAERRPWICSKFDIEWPRSKPGASLVEVALAHDVPVWSNHRALTDCMLLAHTFQRVHELGHDVQAMLARAMRPSARYVANVSYDDRELAKAAGFAWDGMRKQWWKRLAHEDAGSLGFPVEQEDVVNP